MGENEAALYRKSRVMVFNATFNNISVLLVEERHFQQYFSFIGGRKHSTQRKPLTFRTSPINFIT